jgi:uncharacterized surface anchored protein
VGACLSVALAVLLACGAASSLLGKPAEAYAATTGTDNSYVRLYDSSRLHSNISRLQVDGADAYCAEIDSGFESGIWVSAHDAAAYLGQEAVTKAALAQDYVYGISWLTSTQKYFISQTLVWDILNPGAYPGGLRTQCGVSDQDQVNIKAEAIAYWEKYRYSYVGGGTYWDAGTAQDLAQFWVERHTLGSIQLKKSSADEAATNGNGNYSLAGAIYTIYNSDGSAVGTLTIDANGDSNTVSNLWAGEFGRYTVKETKAPKGYEKNETVYTVNLAADGQLVTIKAKDNPMLGAIELQKTSANPSISEGNACYSLGGAKFGIYASASDANAYRNAKATITTNASGFGKVDNLPLGSYWVREYEAPRGYAIDSAIYPVTITASKATVRVSAKDWPKNDPVGVLLQKADSGTAQPYAGSGAASLEGAQFTVRYYDAQLATVADAQAATPERTWVVRTDADGFTALDPGYLVSGDALYLNSAGDPCVPLGTFTVQETKAPLGYLLSTPQYPNVVRIFHITDDGTDGEFVYAFNETEFREQIVRGDVEVVKYQEDGVTGSDLPSELKTPEAGVIFDLYASRDFTGTTPSDGAKPALSLTTDQDGVASSIDAGVCVIQWPDGTYSTRPRTSNDSGALPYDSYLAVQRTVPDGYSPAKPFVVTVKSDKECRTYIVGNTLIPAAIRIEKRDSETDKAVPFPSKWQVISAATGEPVSMTIHYPKTQVIDTFESDEGGWLLLPEMLPVGDYTLHEVEAPAHGGIGYLLNPVDVPFSIDKRYEWDEPLVVVAYDAPAKGQVRVVKADSLSGKAVAGATYAVTAAADVYTLDGTLRYAKGDEVAALVTGDDGSALSDELYLGSYTIREAVTPDGFALNPAIYSVELSYIDQVTTVNVGTAEATDTPTTLDILKVDVSTGKPLSGVTFAIEGTNGSITEVTTGADGHAAYPYLPQGGYRVYETATLPGYTLSDEVREVTVGSDGLIEGQAVYALAFADDFTKVEVTKTDIVTGEPVIGAVLQVFPVDGDDDLADAPLYEWTTAEKPYFIERLPQGDYVLREYSAPAGYVVAQDVPFTVEDTGDIQRVGMQDDFTKVKVTKTDIVTGEPVIGATLQVFPVDVEGNMAEEPLYEWVTSEEPYYAERMAQGDYVLRETSAPDGYVLAQDIPFTVADTAEIQLVDMGDDFTKVEITKADAESGALLSGATLQILDKDGNVLFEWVSTGKPYPINRIPAGDYVLHEVSAPAGYELAADVAFTVKATSDVQAVSMADKAIPAPEKLDQTGRDGSLPFAAIGILALVALGGALFALRHLRKKKDDDGEDADKE